MKTKYIKASLVLLSNDIYTLIRRISLHVLEIIWDKLTQCFILVNQLIRLNKHNSFASSLSILILWSPMIVAESIETVKTVLSHDIVLINQPTSNLIYENSENDKRISQLLFKIWLPLIWPIIARVPIILLYNTLQDIQAHFLRVSSGSSKKKFN